MTVEEAAPWRDAAAAFIAEHRYHPAFATRDVSFLPRLVAYTHEDKAAKGLRSLNAPKTAPEVPVHFSALEMVQEERCLILIAPPGAGKTCFALHLALNLAGALIGEENFNHGYLAGLPLRNDRGDVAVHQWHLPPTLPSYVVLRSGMTVTQTLSRAGLGSALALSGGGPPHLLIVDEVEALGNGWPHFAAALMQLCADHSALRVLLLGETSTVSGWILPNGMARHALLPLPRLERQRAVPVARTGSGTATLGHAAGHAGLFGLAYEYGGEGGSTEAIIDAWHMATSGTIREVPRWLEPLRIAKECALRGDVATAIGLFSTDATSACPAIASLLTRWQAVPAFRNALMEGLMLLPGDVGRRGTILVAAWHNTAPELHSRMRDTLHEIVRHGALLPAERAVAGRTLSQLGDPRDLEALVDIPGGSFTMGCAMHPNSSPAHLIAVAPFRIGAYPVTNTAYATFIAATGRHWASPSGMLAERANMPATDLTWHDARAYCVWLTEVWRKAWRITADQVVRLPTEPEWERAARGDQKVLSERIVYPWDGSWNHDLVNGEALGLNDTCAVGLFPRGCSPYGCFDMAGQVWEWCSTLWGDDMAMPCFTYPYRDDGREALEAPDHIRRVLRGGCFSSGAAKANVTYRGSLEAGGFWRGNGFRVVVAPALRDEA
jgi:iron(II)-dependent oxidoreductase